MIAGAQPTAGGCSAGGGFVPFVQGLMVAGCRRLGVCRGTLVQDEARSMQAMRKGSSEPWPSAPFLAPKRFTVPAPARTMGGGESHCNTSLIGAPSLPTSPG